VKAAVLDSGINLGHLDFAGAQWSARSPSLRGMSLWNKLLATAQPLPFPASKVGKGLVQSP
jgi:subtilisin